MSDHTGSRQRWYRIENAAAPDRAVVRIFDMIGGWFGVWASDLVQELDSITAPVIELHVNSPGGDAFEGIAIMNALRKHPARVEAFVDGMAASAASYIVVGGADEVVMGLGAELMVHNPKMGTYGDAAFHRGSADRLDKIAGDMAGIYTRKAGGTREEWLAAMASESWYTAEEAVAAGLADRIDADEDASAAAAAAASAGVERRIFAYAGRAQAPAPRTPAAAASGSTTTQERSTPVAFSDEQLTTMRQRLGLPQAADEATIVAAFEEALEERAESSAAHTAEEPWRAEAQRLSAELAEIKAERAREAKDAFFAEMSKTGRIKPADRAELERQYDEAPQIVRNIVGARAIGSEVPVAEIGHEGDATNLDASETLEAELRALGYGSLVPTRKER